MTRLPLTAERSSELARTIWQSPLSSWAVVRTLIGALLLTAAVLKGHGLATTPTHVSSWLLSVALIEFEMLLGFWMLSGWRSRWIWHIALVCFGLFALVALRKALAGETSCGCFGRMSINPWYTFVLDVALVAALIAVRPSYPSGDVWSIPLPVAVGAAVLLASVPAVLTGLRRDYSSITADGHIIETDGAFVFLDPESWIGHQLPILSHIDVGTTLSRGHWRLLFYHVNCPSCQAAIAQLDSSPVPSPIEYRVALVEVPSVTSHRAETATSARHCLLGRLSDSHEWFMETPTQVQLADGRVMEVVLPDGTKQR